MLKRIITAIVAVIVFIPAIAFSGTWVFPVYMSLCAFVGCLEMLKCIGIHKNLFLTVPISLVALFFPLFMRYCSLFADVTVFYKLAVGVMLVMMLYVFGVAVFANKSIKITDAGLAISACLYIIAAFTSVVYIRDFIKGGEYIYLLTFICAWATDIFAYFTGRFFGKHKLIPSVSPKKTVEGAVGGIVFCVLAMVGFGFTVERFFSGEQGMEAIYLVLAISGIFISVVSQTGDLIMSLIKRHYGIKDYGKLFPGHGGILDRFDSVLAVSILLAFICTYFDMFAVAI